jgi:lipoprotein-anchoring transpeptidase ErfK/SrfK
MIRCWSVFLLLALALLFSSCVTKDSDHRIVVSVADQSLELYHKETLLGRYPVSTSRFGLGDRPGSRATPLGRMEVAIKIGAGAPLGAVFKSRRRTGEVLVPNAPGRDPIVTRILWLKGLEPQNRHAFARCIYIHGTPEERNVGHPASFGCVRMKSVDMLRVFNSVGVGATVEIIPGSLPDSLAPASNPHVVSGPIASQASPLPVAQAAVVSGSIPVPPAVAPLNSDKKPGS